MFNNKVFSQHTMQPMQPSMQTLYKIAREKKEIKTPTAVARVMEVSQQRLKNWEKRGISKEGAMKAQAVFGIDSNALLASDIGTQATVMVYDTTHDKPLQPPKVKEFKGPRLAHGWPFKNVTPKQWNTLTDKQKVLVENVAASYLNTGDPPLNELSPAQNAAAA